MYMLGKVGFACKYLHPDQTQKTRILEEIQRPLTEKSTTIRWLNNQSKLNELPTAADRGW